MRTHFSNGSIAYGKTWTTCSMWLPKKSSTDCSGDLLEKRQVNELPQRIKARFRVRAAFNLHLQSSRASIAPL